MTKFINIDERETFRYAADHKKEAIYVKTNLSEGRIASNARKIDTDDKCYISPNAKVERIVQAK